MSALGMALLLAYLCGVAISFFTNACMVIDSELLAGRTFLWPAFVAKFIVKAFIAALKDLFGTNA